MYFIENPFCLIVCPFGIRTCREEFGVAYRPLASKYDGSSSISPCAGSAIQASKPSTDLIPQNSNPRTITRKKQERVRGKPNRTGERKEKNRVAAPNLSPAPLREAPCLSPAREAARPSLWRVFWLGTLLLV